ncbi:MAG: zf-HC2 domain-containing protein, partial [Salinibacterium amurskyense]
MNDRNDDLAAQSGAYALNALSPEEREAFEKHLAASDETRTETTELSDTAVALGIAIDPVTPPPALKANLMAMIAQTPQLPREADVAATADDASSSVDAASAPLSNVTPLAASVAPAADASAEQSSTSLPGPATPAETKAQARWFTRPATALAAVAAAVALIVAGGVVADSIGRTS